MDVVVMITLVAQGLPQIVLAERHEKSRRPLPFYAKITIKSVLIISISLMLDR